MLPPGQSARQRSGVGQSVSALSQASLGGEPSLLQLLVESVVCRGNCKRNRVWVDRAQSMGPAPQAVGGEGGGRGHGGFPGCGIRDSVGSVQKGGGGKQACSGMLAPPVPPSPGVAGGGLLPVYSGGTRTAGGLRKACPVPRLRAALPALW